MGALELPVGPHLLTHTSLVLVESALALPRGEGDGQEGLASLSQLHGQE